MLKKNWGRIIFISSECASLVPNDLIPYSMTKASILAISRGLAQLTKDTNITVNTVLPGSTLTKGANTFLNQSAKKLNKSVKEIEDDFFSVSRNSSLIRRFASSSEVANAIVYLSSPLSSATNGSVLKVDGGSVGGIL
jgi:NAD(P)-dependent dehydrogenase (short-subunit alcohol dehydrogenase family)